MQIELQNIYSKSIERRPAGGNQLMLELENPFKGSSNNIAVGRLYYAFYKESGIFSYVKNHLLGGGEFFDITK